MPGRFAMTIVLDWTMTSSALGARSGAPVCPFGARRCDARSRRCMPHFLNRGSKSKPQVVMAFGIPTSSGHGPQTWVRSPFDETIASGLFPRMQLRLHAPRGRFALK
jgi:hypothetical protein